MDEPRDDEPKGTTDAASVGYVLGGIPFLIFFFIALFGLWVGGCDANNVLVHF